MADDAKPAADAAEQYSTEAKKWLGEIDASQDYWEEFQKRARNINQKYRDETAKQNNTASRINLNILWSNVNTLRPATYSQSATPVVERDFRDKDPLANNAGQILERALKQIVRQEEYDDSTRAGVDDYLLVARAVQWFRVEVEKTSEADPETQQAVDVLGHQNICADYVQVDDFLCKPARKWNEVTWVARRRYMTKDEVRAAYGDIKANSLSVDDGNTRASKRDREQLVDKYAIWEIWDKTSRKIYHCSKSSRDLLKIEEDKLQLRDFFPCAKPAFGTMTNDTIIPVPDYAIYQSLDAELQELVKRRSSLTRQLRYSGIYDRDLGNELQRLQNATDGHFVAASDKATISANGGLAAHIWVKPLDDIIKTLAHIDEQLERTKAAIYEITGVSDIIRGYSDPNETATAQGIKGRFAALRLEEKKATVARWVRDGLRICAQILVQFSDEQLAKMANIEIVPDETMVPDMQTGQMPPPPEFPMMLQSEFSAALELLRNPDAKWRIDIETDSTIELDDQEEKKSVNELLEAIAGLLMQAAPIVEKNPLLLPFFKELMLMVVRRYRAGRALEGEIETAFDKMKEQADAAAAAPPPPDAAMAEVQRKSKKDEGDLMLKDKEITGSLAIKGADLQLKARSQMANTAIRSAEAQQRANQPEVFVE